MQYKAIIETYKLFTFLFSRSITFSINKQKNRFLVNFNKNIFYNVTIKWELY